ncbi:cupin-like domain-containing protein [Chitinophaga vietnamensis]|uniref:cupin-like domain-containing protein n=1 Tax=Chitinophaga vietnamensis TaxID=2593957 RepID=UPI001177B204|nr:cupin-like domain-containing protein [Chitinophaga vietnamensis]
MKLAPIPVAATMSSATFEQDYLKTKQPVIIRDFISGPALTKWSYAYFAEKAGNTAVAVHGSEDAHLDKVTSPPERKMTFAAYLDMINAGPTELRLFLFNLLLEKPELKKDLQVKKLTKGLLSWLPFMFFGGAGSSVRYHYDIDMSHVFLSQLHGTKKVYLFANAASPYLYRLPFSFHGLVDLRHPDYVQYPALAALRGWECTLEKGDTLFIPAGYWHYIQYVTDGYSISYRAIPPSLSDKLRGFRNIVLVRRFDNAMRHLFGRRWFDWKRRAAFRNAALALQREGRHPQPVADNADLRPSSGDRIQLFES